MQKRDSLIYRIVTGAFSLFILMGAVMYFFQYDMVAETLGTIGYPTYIIYPLAVAKILGVLALWHKKAGVLKEWAYAGFTFLLVLATSAHLNAGDGQYVAAIVALVLVLVSYRYSKKVQA